MKFKDYTKMSFTELQQYIKDLEADAANNMAIGRWSESFIAQELADTLKNRSY